MPSILYSYPKIACKVTVVSVLVAIIGAAGTAVVITVSGSLQYSDAFSGITGRAVIYKDEYASLFLEKDKETQGFNILCPLTSGKATQDYVTIQYDEQVGMDMV